MRKLIFITLLSLLVVTVSAVEQTVQVTKTEAIELLSHKLDKAEKVAEYAFEKTVEAMPIEGIIGITMPILLIMLMIIAYMAVEKSREKANEKERPEWDERYRSWDNQYGLFKGIFVMIIAVSTIWSLTTIEIAVIKLSNPEYAAIMKILNL